MSNKAKRKTCYQVTVYHRDNMTQPVCVVVDTRALCRDVFNLLALSHGIIGQTRIEDMRANCHRFSVTRGDQIVLIMWERIRHE